MKWTKVIYQGEPPEERSKHSATYIDKKIYVFGGIGSSYFFNDLFVLDTETWNWTKLVTSGQIPSVRAGHAALAAGRKILVIGGFGPGAKGYHNDVYLLDTENLQWKQLRPAGNAPSGRWGHSLVLVGKKAVLFGGYAGGARYHNEMYTLDLEKMQWACATLHGEAPSVRCLQSMLLVDRRLLIFGGFGMSNGVSTFHNDCFLLEIEHLRWRPIATSGHNICGRWGHSAVLVSGHGSSAAKVVVFGGYGPSSEGLRYFNDTCILSTDSFSWSIVPQPLGQGSVPSPRHGHTGVLIDRSRMVVFGGCAEQCNNEVWILHMTDVDLRQSVLAGLAPNGTPTPALAGPMQIRRVLSMPIQRDLAGIYMPQPDAAKESTSPTAADQARVDGSMQRTSPPAMPVISPVTPGTLPPPIPAKQTPIPALGPAVQMPPMGLSPAPPPFPALAPSPALAPVQQQPLMLPILAAASPSPLMSPPPMQMPAPLPATPVVVPPTNAMDALLQNIQQLQMQKAPGPEKEGPSPSPPQPPQLPIMISPANPLALPMPIQPLQPSPPPPLTPPPPSQPPAPRERWEVSMSDLQLKERIGEGAFGEVYRASWLGAEVAVKKLKSAAAVGRSPQLLDEFRKEINVLKDLRHPNIVLFMAACISPADLCIVTEFMHNGSLFHLLHTPQKADIISDELVLLRMVLDVARGINYLHHSGIIHRDLKALNLLVDTNLVVKVADFGLSRTKNISETLTQTNAVGTPAWMAPESLRGEPYTEKSDVYSFGVVLWEIAARSPPWQELHPMQIPIAVGQQGRRLPIPPSARPWLKQLMTRCFAEPPPMRPSFDEILAVLEQTLAYVQQQVAVRNDARYMQSLGPERLCMMCRSAPREMQLFPCGHQVFCSRDALKLREAGRNQCPLCSTPWTYMIKVYS
mmetsp:Transcript_19289/g.31568  ORF Transcript_19289/g.31568 Transcript_19289/m.31568 type:complete len:914 (-) Transcript_19289:355-3096(-)|eukprot:CAMPEP_0184659078 /NCGR_PEP_ID=MMETSP0308-20130426/28081_1 /TAXON_ID=38269 /ORGANISM="Gloeochaete witrockiana, Strain SAG 46.84" /LENGTH=913 /DNA_ID=CAMNT_0027098585 /DNA_START=84 /DNA_END=2825 /DNA_ORIENTATION=-